MDNWSTLGFVRVAAVSPELRVADVPFNTSKIITAARDAAAHGAQITVLPELCVTGYSCADLFYQQTLLDAARAALGDIARELRESALVAVVGVPLRLDGRLFNCAAVIANGAVIGVVPKTYLPTTGEFYEERWFTPAPHATQREIVIGNQRVPFGADLLFEVNGVEGCVIGVEICEDMWAVNPPSGAMALAGATVLLNLSASNELLGKSAYRRDLVRQQSARCLAAYVYAGAGAGESTTDVVYGGHCLIAENGSLLGESARFEFETQTVVADIDLQRLSHERLTNNTFSSAGAASAHRRIAVSGPTASSGQTAKDMLIRPLTQTPFVPSDAAQRAASCEEIFNIQATGLAKRLRHTNTKNVTIGISGGLDSTLALLVTLKAFERLRLPVSGIHAITMPGFGTTDRTYQNALTLMQQLGVSTREISIREAVRQHFRDIGHDEAKHDVTYENAQARERTQILMDVANQVGGFVVGTGDLSELALGWMTFNGDHMSMYHVNAGVPKTLVRYLIEWCAETQFSGVVADTLRDICATPITPELLPLDSQGKLQQQTEDTVGPYVLHDFFLFHVVRYGSTPRRVFALAREAFQGSGDGRREPASDFRSLTPVSLQMNSDLILKWLRVFYARFFANQFKRSAMPDGPKVGSVALSPRGDWRMPSDATAALWLAELDKIQ
jgi:NAD+ synthase (glutamine-hydrolysing)